MPDFWSGGGPARVNAWAWFEKLTVTFPAGWLQGVQFNSQYDTFFRSQKTSSGNRKMTSLSKRDFLEIRMSLNSFENLLKVPLPAALNYGAIGVTIGHELSHQFDSQGSQFDEKGTLQLKFTCSPSFSDRH